MESLSTWPCVPVTPPSPSEDVCGAASPTAGRREQQRSPRTSPGLWDNGCPDEDDCGLVANKRRSYSFTSGTVGSGHTCMGQEVLHPPLFVPVAWWWPWARSQAPPGGISHPLCHPSPSAPRGGRAQHPVPGSGGGSGGACNLSVLPPAATYQKITPLAVPQEPREAGGSYSVTLYIGEQAAAVPRARCRSFVARPGSPRDALGEKPPGAPRPKNKSVFKKFFGKKE